MKYILISLSVALLAFTTTSTILDIAEIRQLRKELQVVKNKVVYLENGELDNLTIINKLLKHQATIDRDLDIIIQILHLVEQRFKQFEKQKNFDFRRENESFRNNPIFVSEQFILEQILKLEKAKCHLTQRNN